MGLACRNYQPGRPAVRLPSVAQFLRSAPSSSCVWDMRQLLRGYPPSLPVLQVYKYVMKKEEDSPEGCIEQRIIQMQVCQLMS